MTIQNTITTLEIAELQRCEETIQRGLHTFVEVGNALLTIRENRLYRQDFGTFEDYCRERWDFTDNYARRLIGSAEVVSNIKSVPIGTVLPASESQARPLVSLPADLQPVAWQRAVDSAPNGRVTAKHVQEVVNRYRYAHTGKAPALTGKYRVIYADPPWKYGNAMPDYVSVPSDYYPLLTIQEIAALPVRDIAEDNAVLFLWVTVPLAREAYDVIDAWGFTYKTQFIWDKVKHNMGHYTSVRHELLYICTRGSCQPDVQKLFDSVQSIERTEHSVKPEEFRTIIDTIYPYGKRIELFARRAVEGWDTWGNEVTA